jgi:hypothetical protein
MRYNGSTFLLPNFRAYNVDSAGKVVLSSQASYQWESLYYDEAHSESPVLNRLRVNYIGPARRVGEALMSIDTVDNAKGRRAWQYLPGQRRVRLAPDLAYDTPNPSTAGMSTVDDVNMFNGRLDRFDWKLVGKREVFVPYNTYRFTYAVKPEEVFGPKVINPSFVRFELHRVWVVEAKLKEGQRHIYSRRTFYVDEDSWNIVANDQYDAHGQMWRPGFGYVTQSYDLPVPSSVTEGHYDLIAGSYYINAWPGPGGIKVTETVTPDSEWAPDSIAAQGIR